MNPPEIITATIGAFTAFLPSAISVRHHDPGDERRIKDLRLGFLYGGVISFSIAAYYASKDDDATPLLYWMLAAGGMIALYEWSFRNRDDVDLRGT